MTVDEIFMTTAFDRADSEKLASALAGAAPFIVSSFWALVKAGCFSADEMVEQLCALRSIAR